MIESDLCVPIARRKMNLFFLIDVSGSVNKIQMGILNQAMEETMNALRTNATEADVHVSVLTFGHECKWMNESPKSVNDFAWRRLSDSIGLTPLGKAFDMLNDRLDEDLKNSSNCYSPAVILVSDCGSTEDYGASLKNLKENRWFKYCTRYVLGLGDNTRSDIALDFAGSAENVMDARGDRLSDMIKFVTLTTSRNLAGNTEGKSQGLQQEEEPPEEEEPEPVSVKFEPDDDWD